MSTRSKPFTCFGRAADWVKGVLEYLADHRALRRLWSKGLYAYADWDGVHEAAARLETNAEVFDLEERVGAHYRPRSLGSSASRSASPMRSKPITAMTMATPGKIARNGAVCR